jgi:hypothetical protein
MAGFDNISPLKPDRNGPLTSGFTNCASEVKLSELVNDHGKFFGSGLEIDKFDNFGTENTVMKLIEAILAVNTGYHNEGDAWKKSVLIPNRVMGTFVEEAFEMESPFFYY